MRRCARPPLRHVLILGVLLAAACEPKPRPQPGPPPSLTVNGRALPLDSLLKAAQALRYDTLRPSEAQAIAGDSGAILQIRAVEGSRARAVPDYTSGQFVATIVNRGKGAYPRLAVPAGGQSYWFIWRDAGAAEEGFGWYAKLLAAGAQGAVDTSGTFAIDFRREEHGMPVDSAAWINFRSKQGAGRARSFALVLPDAWTSCVETGCCTIRDAIGF